MGNQLSSKGIKYSFISEHKRTKNKMSDILFISLNSSLEDIKEMAIDYCTLLDTSELEDEDTENKIEACETKENVLNELSSIFKQFSPAGCFKEEAISDGIFEVQFKLRDYKPRDWSPDIFLCSFNDLLECYIHEVTGVEGIEAEEKYLLDIKTNEYSKDDYISYLNAPTLEEKISKAGILIDNQYGSEFSIVKQV